MKDELVDTNLGEFVFLKLNSSETLFAERLGEENQNYTVLNPILIKAMAGQNGSDLLYGADWLPFTDIKIHQIPKASVVVSNKLSDKYVKFYGSVILKTKLSELQDEARERIEDGEHEVFVMLDVITRMEEESDYLSEKFAIERPDFSEMKGQYAENRSKIVH